MTQEPVNMRRGRERGSFHALRLSRRNALRRGKTSVKRSRQAEVRERRTRILLMLTMALGFELAAAALTSPLLGINRIAIRGTEQLPVQEIEVTRHVAAIPAGSNLLRVPLGHVEQRMKALPWVQSARAGWMSPHALSIRVTPRQPVVVAEAAGQRFEVDAAGVPIRVARAGALRALPQIMIERAMEVRPGVPLRDEALLAAIKIYHDAPSQPMVHIAKIKVDPAGNMCLNMSDGIQVQLGQPEDLAAKMKYVQHVYQLDPNVCSRMIAINLSVPKQPACTLKKDVQPDPAMAETPGTPKSQDSDGGVTL